MCQLKYVLVHCVSQYAIYFYNQTLDPPDGVPTCSLFPVKNYTDLALFCLWKGGYPPATLKWSPYVNDEKEQGVTNVTQIQSGLETANNSVYTCYGSHVALNLTQTCSIRTCKYEIQ